MNSTAQPNPGRANSGHRRITVLMSIALLAGLMIGIGTSAPAAQAITYPEDQVYVADGRFQVNGEPIALKGVNVEVESYFTREDFARMASWGVNSVRLRVHWTTLEREAPVWDGEQWIRTYDERSMAKIKRYIRWAWEYGIHTIVDNHDCRFCPGNVTGDPMWAAQAPYNSAGRTYDVWNKKGWLEYHGDLWTDQARKGHIHAVLWYLATQLKDEPGVIGYQLMNEPQPGDMPFTAESTRLVSRVQRNWAETIRKVDPDRVIFFQTRYGYLPGLANAELDKWAALGNVAADLHDGFGARWGVGVEYDPKRPEYKESLQKVNVNINDPESPPWSGTTVAKMNHYLNRLKYLEPYGIPLYVGEFGNERVDNGALQYWGATLGALCQIGDARISWSTRDWKGPRGIFDDAGRPQPWADMVIEAFSQEC